jgi:hypothetical protein
VLPVGEYVVVELLVMPVNCEHDPLHCTRLYEVAPDAAVQVKSDVVAVVLLYVTLPGVPGALGWACT